MNRAYSLIELKAVDEDKRIIEGIASTPTPDRVEDIVEPMGAEFKLPLPFLWQHDKNQPIGHVTRAKPTKKGIPVKIQMVRTDEPGTLKDRLDEAWQSIKLGLVRGLSIGFKALETADIEGTFGVRFMKWEWLELSAVTIPANADATILAVKQYDEQSRAATGNNGDVSHSQPGDSGDTSGFFDSEVTTKRKPLTGHRKGGQMTITERIGAMEAKLAAHLEKMNEIEAAAAERGETLDDSEQEEFDTLHAEREQLKKDLARARLLEKENAAKAKPVEEKAHSIQSASDSRSPVVRVEREEKLDPGIEFARYAMCLYAAEGDPNKAYRLAETHYPKQQRALNVLKAAASRGMKTDKMLYGMMELQSKAAVAGGTTTDSTWALPLVEYNQFAGDFVEFLRPRTIIGQFGSGGIPDFRRIPFNVHIRGQTAGGTGYWVGEGLPKPVTKSDYNDTYHGFFKLACISVLAEELIRFSDPSAERLVRDDLAATIIAKMDNDFIDFTAIPVANVQPGSITYDVTATTSSGTDADAVRADIQALWAAAIAANLPLTSAVYITTPAIGLALGLLTNALGQPEFPTANMNGGTLLGVPIITSNHVGAGEFILAFASEIWMSDDGVVTIDASREASIQMLDNPTNDTATPTATTMTSMWQTNSVALRAERFINWSKRRTQAVARLNNVAWNGAALS